MLSTTTTTITAASLYPSDIVYAKWRGRVTNQPLQHDLPSYTDYYDVTLLPELPLSIGRVIKIRALMETHHTLLDNPVQLIQYDSYDPRVEGRITRIRSAEGNTIEFVLENHTKDSVVSLVYISVPYIPRVTATLGIFGRVFQWLAARKNHPDARSIHLESALVVHTVTEFSPRPPRQTGPVQKLKEYSEEQRDETRRTPVESILGREDSGGADDHDWKEESECGTLL